MKRLLILAAILALMLALASPALAEHTAEHVQESTQRMQGAFLPPGAGDVMGIFGLDLSGTYRALSLHDLGMLCSTQGGYYYDGGDGYLYWNACTGAGA